MYPCAAVTDCWWVDPVIYPHKNAVPGETTESGVQPVESVLCGCMSRREQSRAIARGDYGVFRQMDQ